MTPIVCVGETLDEREAGDTEAKVLGQVARRARRPHRRAGRRARDRLRADLGDRHRPDGHRRRRPGRVRRDPRRAWRRAVGADAAAAVRIQYGGSVKAANIAELMAAARHRRRPRRRGQPRPRRVRAHRRVSVRADLRCSLGRPTYRHRPSTGNVRPEGDRPSVGRATSVRHPSVMNDPLPLGNASASLLPRSSATRQRGGTGRLSEQHGAAPGRDQVGLRHGPHVVRVHLGATGCPGGPTRPFPVHRPEPRRSQV